VVILLMAFDEYSISEYWCLLMSIELVDINGYFIGGY